MDKLTDDEKEEVKQQVAFFKEYRETIFNGTFYRLLSPFEGNETCWMVVSQDQKTALVGYYRPLNEVNVGFRRVKLQGLNPDFKYNVSMNETTNYGDELMNVGLITSDGSCGENKAPYDGTNGDYQSRIYLLKAE